MDIIGRILAGRYEIIEKVGEGGMAIVYKAKCNLLNRYVAIKILKSEFSKDDTFVKRFKAEAQSAASLTHPNIVSVYDVGQEAGDINYIVMELLETKTLKDYIDEKGSLSNELTLKIAAQIASALEAAHKSHIIHRDIKPHNIVLNKNMVAKVTDFGIAKITNTTTATITTLGTTVGSVHYFSPEHAKGGYTDEKSDIYSLGVVMYEMSTGKLPFDGDSPVAVALKQIQEEPVPPIEIDPNISVALNQVIMKAMEKNTAKRYQNATELLSDISKALASPNNMLIQRPTNSVEAGATQVIPTLGDVGDEYLVPNLRTRQARKMSVVSASRANDDEDDDEYLENLADNDSDYNKDKNNYSKKDGAKKKSKKKIIIISVIVAVIVLSIIIFLGVKLNNAKKLAEANKAVDVPNLVGRVFTEVVTEYSAQGLEIIQDKSEYDDTQPEGSIISQTPEKGATTKDKKIYVVVSKGQKMVEVTDVVTKDSKVAKYELEDTLGFKVTINEVISTKVAAGIVISQKPLKGEKVAFGSEVILEVSKGDGKATVLMPDVLGKTEAEAKKALEDLKLTVNVKTGEDSAKTNGVVITQNYPQNQQLKEGALVEITVNKLLITKTISMDLLELQGGTKLEEDTMVVKVTASIDGGAVNTVYEKTLPTTQKTATFDINGYKSANLKIYINGKLNKEQNINF